MSAFWTRGRDSSAESENAVAGPRARTWRLTAVDRCDRCGAQAYVRVLLPSRLELLFCAHHNRKYATALVDIAVEIQDETMRLASCALFGIGVSPIPGSRIAHTSRGLVRRRNPGRVAPSSAGPGHVPPGLCLTSKGGLMVDSTQSSGGVITKPSSKPVAQTIDGLRRVMADRGFTVFNVIDHSGVAGRAGVQMPDSKLVMFGKPAVGASVMLAAPLAALDIPLKVLVWEDRNGAVSVSYNSPGFLAGRHHLEGALRAPFDAVESIVEALPGA
jgi:uncharacterized protein (DUF302 family)